MLQRPQHHDFESVIRDRSDFMNDFERIIRDRMEGLQDNKTYFTINTENLFSKIAYALLVEEDYWENLTKDTILIVDPILQVKHRDFVIVHKNGQETPTIKQMLFDEGQMYLKPLTQKFNITAFTPEHSILGIVVECKKQLRKLYL